MAVLVKQIVEQEGPMHRQLVHAAWCKPSSDTGEDQASGHGQDRESLRLWTTR